MIAGCQYAVEGSKCVQASCPAEVRAFVEKMLAEVRWQPDPIFMVDIGEADGRLWLVELSGFSCSWLYACDVEAVVAAAGDLATRAWQRAAGATA